MRVPAPRRTYGQAEGYRRCSWSPPTEGGRSANREGGVCSIADAERPQLTLETVANNNACPRIEELVPDLVVATCTALAEKLSTDGVLSLVLRRFSPYGGLEQQKQPI